jgi:hypothetical protein
MSVDNIWVHIKLHTEELPILYSSSNTIRHIKSRGTKWEGHAARIGEERKVHNVFGGKDRRKKTTRKTEDGSEWIFGRLGAGSEFSWLTAGIGGGLL